MRWRGRVEGEWLVWGLRLMQSVSLAVALSLWVVADGRVEDAFDEPVGEEREEDSREGDGEEWQSGLKEDGKEWADCSEGGSGGGDGGGGELEVEDHDCDDDGEDAVGEGFESAFVHCGGLSVDGGF